MLAPFCIKALPSISNVRLGTERVDADGSIHRTWIADVAAADASFAAETRPVRYDAAVADESAEAKQRREHREAERAVRALRELDASVR